MVPLQGISKSDICSKIRCREEKRPMPSRWKKMIAPIVITVIFLIYLIVYLVFITAAAQEVPVLVLLAIPLIALATAMIMVLKDRIKEIKGGEDDDLSNY